MQSVVRDRSRHARLQHFCCGCCCAADVRCNAMHTVVHCGQVSLQSCMHAYPTNPRPPLAANTNPQHSAQRPGQLTRSKHPQRQVTQTHAHTTHLWKCDQVGVQGAAARDVSCVAPPQPPLKPTTTEAQASRPCRCHCSSQQLQQLWDPTGWSGSCWCGCCCCYPSAVVHAVPDTVREQSAGGHVDPPPSTHCCQLPQRHATCAWLAVALSSSMPHCAAPHMLCPAAYAPALPCCAVLPHAAKACAHARPKQDSCLHGLGGLQV
jgi:hypothetical protein